MNILVPCALAFIMPDKYNACIYPVGAFKSLADRSRLLSLICFSFEAGGIAEAAMSMSDWVLGLIPS